MSCEFPTMTRATILLDKLSCSSSDCSSSMGSASSSCQSARQYNSRMPQGAPALPLATIETLKTWIDGGFAGCP
jgi:hypothetical protein